VTEDDPTKPAGEFPHVSAVPVVAAEHQEPEVAPPPRSPIPKRWLPLAAIIAVAAVALAIALPLTLGSSSSVTPTPTAPVKEAISGSYLTGTVQDQRLVFASLLETSTQVSGTQVSGSLTVTTSGPAHKHLVAHLYTVTGTVAGSVLHLLLTPTDGTAAALPFTATYASGTITATIGTGATLTLERGTLAKYRLLVRQDRVTLLS